MARSLLCISRTFKMKTNVCWEHNIIVKDLASTPLQSYWLGLKGAKKKIAKRLGTLCTIQTSTLLPTMHMASSCEATNWYSIIVNILLHVSLMFHQGSISLCAHIHAIFQIHISYSFQSLYSSSLLFPYLCFEYMHVFQILHYWGSTSP